MYFEWYPYDSFGQDIVACTILTVALGVVWRWTHQGRLFHAILFYLGVMTGLVGLQQWIFDTDTYGSFFGALRMTSWAIFLFAPVACLIAAFHTRNAVRNWLMLLSFMLGGVGINAFWIEPTNLQVTSYTVVNEKVTDATRIVLVADVQTDTIDAYTKHALQTAIQQQPDIVVFAGDYLQYSFVREFPSHVESFNNLLHQLGYANVPSIVVEGDVEDKLKDDWHHLFKGLPATILDPSSRTTWNEWEIIGLTRNDSMYGRVLHRTKSDRFTIVVGHNPNFALQRPEADLYLAGHTHGGQVNLPWIGPVITFSDIPNDQAQGRSDLDNGATLIVSRGIGMERVDAPRIRFLCAPEIVVIDVLPSVQR